MVVCGFFVYKKTADLVIMEIFPYDSFSYYSAAGHFPGGTACKQCGDLLFLVARQAERRCKEVS
jgi:hypothetical protein